MKTYTTLDILKYLYNLKKDYENIYDRSKDKQEKEYFLNAIQVIEFIATDFEEEQQ